MANVLMYIPVAFGLDGKHMNLCFLGFYPLPESEVSLRFRQDGYFGALYVFEIMTLPAVLSQNDFEKVLDSIFNHRSITMLTKTGCSFHLNTVQDMYHDHAKKIVST